MNIIKDHPETIVRKSLAILSLPMVTNNGQVRNVNVAQGQTLAYLCGFDYKQSSITKYLAELKSLGVSTAFSRTIQDMGRPENIFLAYLRKSKTQSRTRVFRAIVMDGANNSVQCLRAFSTQDTFHYISTLDDNQWNDRFVRSRSCPTRYRYGDATLRDLDIELEDSQEKGYMSG